MCYRIPNKTNLVTAIPIAQRKYDLRRDTDQDSISSVSDSDYSTDSEDESRCRKMPKIRLFVQQITDQVQSLHEISALLRRPTVTNKFIRSINVRPEATSTDNLRLSDAFGLFDENHILEKVLQWRGFGKTYGVSPSLRKTWPSSVTNLTTGKSKMSGGSVSDLRAQHQAPRAAFVLEGSPLRLK